MSKIFLTSSTFTWSYPGQNTVVPPVVRSRTVYMTIGCRRLLWREIRSCASASAVTVANVVNGFSGKTPPCPATIVPLAEWLKAATIRQKP